MAPKGTVFFFSYFDHKLCMAFALSGFLFEAGGRTFHPVIFHSMSGTLISMFERFFIILL